MLLRSNDRDQADKEALRDDKIKRDLEEKLERDLAVLFRRIARDMERSLKAIGLVPDHSVYIEQLAEILAKGQKRTADIFTQTIRNGTDSKKSLTLFETKAELVDIPEDEEEDLAAVIGGTMALFIAEQSVAQARLILETNEKEMQRDVLTETNNLLEAGEIATLAAVAVTATALFAKKAQSRIKTIAVQNVGMTESESRQVEAEAMNQSTATIDGEAVAGRIGKNWNAILDERTRAAHIEADLTYSQNPIPVDDFFLVGGENLKFPRDPSGSAGNIINCRCIAQQMLLSTGG